MPGLIPPLDVDAPIGIFDSGFGGLTVARAVLDQLPHESTIYLGDTARQPYGPKPLAEVREYALECLDHLVDHTLTSDVASDRFALDPVSGGTTVTFARASRHVVTVSYEGGSQAIPFDVSPDAGASAGHDATGTLAYTGSDTSGPLGWALGLLAAGGGLLLHRLRRRRA